MSLNLNLVGGSHLLHALGVDPVMDQLTGFKGNLGFLGQLGDNFSFTASMQLNFSANSLANMIQSGAIPGAGFMHSPSLFGCPCAHMFAAPRGFDFGASAPGSNFFERIMNRRQGAKFERFLQKNPFARQHVEMMLGGRIIPDGKKDGRIFIQPFPPGHFPGGGSLNQSANSALDMLNGLHRAATGLGMPGASPLFPMMMMGALAQMLGGGNGASPFNFGGNTGVHQQGVNGPHTQKFGLSGGDDVSGVLNDPSLTVEDKVTLMIMMIMKKMDKDIEKQANYVNKLQQQQSKEGGGGGGKGGKGGGGGGGKSPSIDVETMKLKRLIDKRSQMFDMLRQIIDKYNQTAKGIIDSMGR